MMYKWYDVHTKHNRYKSAWTTDEEFARDVILVN